MAEQVSLAKTAAMGVLEGMLNRALALDPGTRHALQSLHGHVFALACTEPPLEIYLHVDAPLRLSERFEGVVTTRIVGRAKDFAALVSAEDPASALINSDISVHGKSGPLIELQGILKNIDIDWEEPLADLFGDPLGHQLGRGIRGAAAMVKTIPPRVKARVEKHVFDEARLTPRREEFDAWVKGVADLNIEVERLRAKIHLLRRRRNLGVDK
ncbi:MAG TPA: SCP2 sterol-binding domain-containing protein [Pseudomonadales bacterium]|nr:SCP2 sterol-binding domain-containing protein [Pseudomonadales bacterium]